MGVKGYFFSFDAFLAASIILTGVLLASSYYHSERESSQITYASRDMSAVLSEMKMAHLHSTKAQAWYMDFALGLTIFAIACVIFFNSTSDILDANRNEFASISMDAGSISSILLTNGYPADWDNASVKIIGIANKNRINDTKLLRAYNVSYPDSKTLFGTKHEYAVFLADNDGNTLNLGGFCGLGNAASMSILSAQYCSNFSMHPDNLAKSERIVIYRSGIARMAVYAWQ